MYYSHSLWSRRRRSHGACLPSPYHCLFATWRTFHNTCMPSFGSCISSHLWDLPSCVFPTPTTPYHALCPCGSLPFGTFAPIPFPFLPPLQAHYCNTLYYLDIAPTHTHALPLPFVCHTQCHTHTPSLLGPLIHSFPTSLPTVYFTCPTGSVRQEPPCYLYFVLPLPLSLGLFTCLLPLPFALVVVDILFILWEDFTQDLFLWTTLPHSIFHSLFSSFTGSFLCCGLFYKDRHSHTHCVTLWTLFLLCTFPILPFHYLVHTYGTTHTHMHTPHYSCAVPPTHRQTSLFAFGRTLWRPWL